MGRSSQVPGKGGRSTLAQMPTAWLGGVGLILSHWSCLPAAGKGHTLLRAIASVFPKTLSLMSAAPARSPCSVVAKGPLDQSESLWWTLYSVIILEGCWEGLGARRFLRCCVNITHTMVSMVQTFALHCCSSYVSPRGDCCQQSGTRVHIHVCMHTHTIYESCHRYSVFQLALFL